MPAESRMVIFFNWQYFVVTQEQDDFLNGRGCADKKRKAVV